MTDFAFRPSAFMVPARQQISPVANNAGAITRRFLIMKLGHDITGHFTTADQSNACWEQGQIPARQNMNTRFAALTEPGTYQICRVDAALMPLTMAVGRTFCRALWGRHGDQKCDADVD